MAGAASSTPRPSSAAARERMRATGRRDTAAEMAVRRAAHRLGLRYRVDAPALPGLRRRADLLFTRARVAVFVDGCFWHGCPTHGSRPRANAQWWAEKIAANRRRDADTDARLVEANWISLRVWEHEDPEDAAARIAHVVRGQGSS